MDPLSDILTLMRPNGYGFRGLDAAGDWSLAFAAADGIRCFAIEAGGCWLRLLGTEPPMRLDAGAVVLLTGGGGVHLFSSEKAEPIDSVAFLSGVPAGAVAVLNGGGECRGIGGFFRMEGSEVAGILATLPPVVHVRAEGSRTALHAGVQRLMLELSEPRPGGALLASHLAQALLVEALRAHLDDLSTSRGWLAALAVPALRRALTAMHADVARRWTLRDLAETAGMSRASFAAHFERTTGETPIAYLTRWRMFLAADRLADPALSLTDVALLVGYESESAFGATFKRVMGCSPRQYRTRSGTRPETAPSLSPNRFR
jgi:AraC-like DNA-binding protein